ncbi:MAG: type II toxin-antitoxin system VapC family toxin [Oscillospiraceae bacterium]|nr:type II toxin-antitoxin system VapC family toxin [Oscillospiraceae bacterium]
MKYLLDTHVAIWALDDKTKLSEKAKAIIDDVSLVLCVSMVSAWEIAIKASIDKLDFVGGSETFLTEMQKNGLELLNLKGPHIKYVENLPFHHRDPFDRLLISTALAEKLTIITIDENTMCHGFGKIEFILGGKVYAAVSC